MKKTKNSMSGIILAGVTIAMLSGENGILSRATETRSTNADAQADEQAKLAYMGVRTEIIAERVTDASYNASDHTEELGRKVEKDLDPKKEKKTWSVDYGTSGIITMTFTDSSLNTTNHQIEYTIELTSGTAVTLNKNGSPMSSGGSEDPGSGGSGGGTASTVVFPNGQDVGQDVTIGEERFKIIKKSTDGKTITAMPYYNLYIAGNPTTIKQATEDNYSSAGKIAFAPGSSPTWGVGKNIDIDNTTTYPNNVKEPIAKYETYLRDTLGASNVVAKIGRYYQVGTADATITEAEYIGNLSGLNPGSAATFWLGSSTSLIADNVHLVDSNGSVGYNDFYDASYGGVRPVIIITIS